MGEREEVTHKKVCRKCVKPQAWRSSPSGKISRIKEGSCQGHKGPQEVSSLSSSHHPFPVPGLNSVVANLAGSCKDSPTTKSQVKPRACVFSTTRFLIS